jgi:hypothetical protein
VPRDRIQNHIVRPYFGDGFVKVVKYQPFAVVSRLRGRNRTVHVHRSAVGKQNRIGGHSPRIRNSKQSTKKQNKHYSKPALFPFKKSFFHLYHFKIK